MSETDNPGIKVELIDSMGDDLAIANAARVSFAKWKEELDQNDARLINYLAEHKHSSPFRHNAISIRVTAPIWLARQLGKHQAGLSWNEVSRRYVDDEPKFFIPTKFRKRPDASIKQGSGDEVDDRINRRLRTGLEYIHALTEGVYEGLLEEGIAPELARGVLPQNMLTSWVWTGNLLAFAHCYNLRADSHAQLEAQEFAAKLSAIIEPLFPNAWAALTKKA